MKRRMIQLFSALCMVFLAAVTIAPYAEAKLPTSMSDFDKNFVEQAKTPEGAALIWISANFLYSSPVTRQLGRDLLVRFTENLSADFEKKASDATYVERIKDETHIFHSYCQGATPENGYKADVNNCELNITKTKENSDGSWSVYLKSGGADSARQLKLVKKDDGLYHVSHYSSIYQKIRPIVK